MTIEALEQLIAAAQAAGAGGMWLLRGATEAELHWTDEPDPDAHLPFAQLRLTSPHELIVIIRFRDGDGGESGVEFRQ